MNGAPPPLRFERIRNFGRIFGDTRRFIQENFSVFFRTIIFLVGPFALLTCTLEKFYEVNLVQHPEESFTHFGSYLAMSQIYSQLRCVINGFITAIVVSHFMKVYREKGHGKFDVSDVSKSIFKDFFGNALAFIFLFFSVGIISVVLFYLIYGLAQVSIGAAIALVFAGWLAYFLIRFPFWYFVYSVFIARTSSEKNKNVFSGISLAGNVFSGNWWSTWVVLFCMWLLLYIVGTCISMPAQIIAMIAQVSSFNPEKTTNWKLIESVLLSLAEFGKTIVNSIFMITVALQFYSLKEKVDGAGTKKIVEMIGTENNDEEIELTY